jgi:amino-acid N-acetyltransferase
MLKDLTVRQATLGDCEQIFSIISDNRDMLISRSMGDIVSNIDRFVVAEKDGHVCASASYVIHPEIGSPLEATVEIQSLAVREDFRTKGIGRIIVETLIERLSAYRLKDILVLTIAPKFFSKLGFVEIPKTQVMHKLYTGCINCTKHTNPFTCPEIAMIRSFKSEDTFCR